MRQAERQVTTFANDFILASGLYHMCFTTSHTAIQIQEDEFACQHEAAISPGALCRLPGTGRRQFKQVSKEPLRLEGSFPKGLRIFFWTPDIGPGANVIVHDMLPSLQRQIAEMSLDWHVSAGPQVPTHALDWLVCFKAVPEAHQRSVASRTMLLICDRIELFWDRVSKFDALVGTSSRPFAQLLTMRHKEVIFIPESEPPEYLDFGKKNLGVSPAERGNVLLWHGGHYSQDALVGLRPILERWAKSADAQLHVVSGQKPPREERWGNLPVHFLPWSKKQLFSSAAKARLGIIPAREGLTRSWLKPASRVRCLYALGVPTVGDSRVPDAVDFMSGFGGPMARRKEEWSQQSRSSGTTTARCKNSRWRAMPQRRGSFPRNTRRASGFASYPSRVPRAAKALARSLEVMVGQRKRA